MYRVLYRKYRPRVFADVIGQPQVTDTLRNEIRSDRLAHAYLFTGSRGTGKTTCSKILSKAVNCLSPVDGDPCGECEICRGIDDGSIMDVVEIDAASNNGVDDIRMLREEADFTPANAKYRVYIIDEVHMLSIGAFNALLKTLEEPPAHVIFILATTEVHKLPATIMSRCQRFDFHRISPTDIAQRLEYVCAQENCTIDREAALLIAGIADGAMRDSLSLLDQAMGQSEHITEELVRRTAGLADKSSLIAICDCILNKDAAGAIDLIDELHRSSKDMARLCEELVEHFRAMMLIKTMKQPEGVLVMSEDDLKKTAGQASKLKLQFIISSIDKLQNAYDRMLHGVNRRIEMEMTLVHLCSESKNPDISALEQKVIMLEEVISKIVSNPGALSAARTSGSVSNAMLPQQKPPSTDEMAKLRENAVPMEQWHEVLEEISRSSKSLSSGFEGSRAFISGKYVLVDSDRDICFELLRLQQNREKMKAAIMKVTGKSYSLGRYSYPDEKKTDDALLQLMNELKNAGIPVSGE
ncbi:MAG: DNA polymerase III subunit gamma/tau [Clostridia bacterium]|nr:DNA polymerase III subunit gamma/tau [Clostridia bacterium]